MADYAKHTTISSTRNDSTELDFKRIDITYEVIEEGKASSFRGNINKNFSGSSEIVSSIDKKIEENNKVINKAINEIWTDKHGVVVSSGKVDTEGKEKPVDASNNIISQANGEIWFKIIE